MRPIDDRQAREKVAAAKSAVVSRWAKIREQNEAAMEAAAAEGEGGAEAGEQSLLDRYMPTPQVAAVAVMALLAAGVVLGAVTDQLAQSAGAPVIVLGEPASAPEEEPAEQGVETEYVTEAAPEAAPAAEAPLPEAEGLFEEAPEKAPPEEKAPFELPPETVLPPVSHVFLIVLGDQGYESTFGKKSASSYFAKALAKKGELLSNYYGVAQSDLANEIALLSGQGPTAQTAAGCPEYGDIAPGTVDPATTGTTEAVLGTGCVYPAATSTLPGQLAAAGQAWKAYLDPAPSGAPAGPPPCGAGGATFAYFHSLLDNGECATSAVGLDQLAPDLAKTVTEVPALSYIVANACHDGSELPCAPGQPAGLAGAESFLSTVIPEIEESNAYKFGGLIAITFAQAPQSGPAADSSACCGTPEYPNLKDPNAPPPPPANGPVKPTGGGGRVGMLLISPYVLPGSVNKTGYFNHYTLLRSIEELFGLSALGYAADPAVIPFDETVYNNLES